MDSVTEPTGALYLPIQLKARLPAVALFHGGGGIEGNAVRWTRTLNGIGVAVFLVDSYTGRVSLPAILLTMPMGGT